MDKSIFLLYGGGAIAVLAALFWPKRAAASEVEQMPAEIPPAQQPLPVVADTRPRGIRNNNPGNIEKTSIQWRGLVGSDGRYAKFDTPINGIRALLLEVYDAIERDGDNTIRKLISVWAPANENDTVAYVNSVSRATNIASDSLLSYRLDAIPIAKAITKHENGVQPYTEQQFLDAYSAAGKYV